MIDINISIGHHIHKFIFGTDACDIFVSDFPYDFQASQLATGYGECVYIAYEYRAIFA